MSQKIQDVLEVLQQSRSRFTPGIRLPQVSKIRIDSVNEVAKRRGVADRTVNDACIRRLEPDISSTQKFDELLLEWLNGKPQRIEQILRRHQIDNEDDSLINNFFSI